MLAVSVSLCSSYLSSNWADVVSCECPVSVHTSELDMLVVSLVNHHFQRIIVNIMRRKGYGQLYSVILHTC